MRLAWAQVDAASVQTQAELVELWQVRQPTVSQTLQPLKDWTDQGGHVTPPPLPRLDGHGEQFVDHQLRRLGEPMAGGKGAAAIRTRGAFHQGAGAWALRALLRGLCRPGCAH